MAVRLIKPVPKPLETKSRKSCIKLVSFPTYNPITQSSETVPESFYKLQIQ